VKKPPTNKGKKEEVVVEEKKIRMIKPDPIATTKETGRTY